MLADIASSAGASSMQSGKALLINVRFEVPETLTRQLAIGVRLNSCHRAGLNRCGDDCSGLGGQHISKMGASSTTCCCSCCLAISVGSEVLPLE